MGTADSSGRTIDFYRSCGFLCDAGRIAGFFDAYPDRLSKTALQAHDMVRFGMVL